MKKTDANRGFTRARKKPININILGGTVSRTNRAPSLGQTGPHAWDKLGPGPGTNRPFSVYFHSKIAILSRLSLGWVGVRPWDDCPARAVRKMFTCFLFIGFFFFHPQFTSLGISSRICCRTHGILALLGPLIPSAL